MNLCHFDDADDDCDDDEIRKKTMASDNVVTQPTTEPIHFALQIARTHHTLHLHVAANSPVANGILYVS